MDEEKRRLTAQGLAVIVGGGSLGIGGVALIIGAIAANAIGQDRGGIGSTLVVASVVAVLTTASGLAIRRILTAESADRRLDDGQVGGKTAWPGHTTS
jgi:hypothetical protein